MENILFYSGLIEWTWVLIIFVILGVTQLTIQSVTIFLHRFSSHKSLELHPWLCHFYQFWLWLTTGMVTKEWTAVHRCHHDKVETDEDPHSPHKPTKWNLLTFIRWGSERYSAATKDPEIIEKYGKNTFTSWMDKNVYAHTTDKWYTSRRWYGLILNGLAMVILFGPAGIAIFGIQYAWIPFHGAGVINGVGHMWGYRNYETADESRNMYPIAFWIGGEELHNNHHGSPNSAKFSHRKGEFDIGWLWIQLFVFLRLAKVVRIYPKPEELERAVGNWPRMHQYREVFVSDFVTNVLKPTMKSERESLSDMAKKARKNFLKQFQKNPKRLSEAQSSSLLEDLENHPNLLRVYTAWNSFVQNWDTPSSNTKEAMEKFEAWCKEAQQSGVQILEEFAEHFEKFLSKPATT